MEEKLFKIEKLRDSNMSQTGKATLRALNGKDLNKVNILIREVFQNSLDARIDNIESVKVEIFENKFDNLKFSNLFEEVENKLLNMFGNNSSFIAFKDSNTKGLTGPIHKGERNRRLNDQENERLINLVYSIGVEQTQSEAGGSWGYGKASLFKFGKGLVIFYTRIKENNEYKSRLICEVIENPKKKKSERILGESNNTLYKGIAWFGDKKTYEYDDGSKENSTIPICDEEKINKVLDIFGINPYIGTETGTTTIIPYIDSQKILDECNESENENEILYWFQEQEDENLKDYIELCISRWYTFRLNNDKLINLPMLEVYYNNEKYEREYEYDFFKTLKYMYNLKNEKKEQIVKDAITYNIKDVNISNHSNGVYDLNVGKYIYAEFPKNMFENTPFEYVFDKEVELDKDKGLNKIALYCRKPGMISNYECKGKWTDGITKLNNEENYFVGLFVLNSDAIINVKGNIIKIEEFVRGIEDAVHAEWEDTKSLTIKDGEEDKNIDISKFYLIKWIQNRIKVILKNSYGKEEIINGTSLSSISREFSKLILPKKGFGTAPGRPRPTGGKGEDTLLGGSTPRGNKIILQKLNILDNSITKELELYISSKGMQIIPKIVMDTSWDLEKFYNEFNYLPIKIIGLKINRIVYKNESGVDLANCFVKTDNSLYEENEIYIKANKIENLDKIKSFDIRKDNKQIDHLEGYIEYKFEEKEYNVSLEKAKIEDKEENDE